MTDKSTDHTATVHALAATLPRYRFPVSRRETPASGVSLLFEEGEVALAGDSTVERIVHVGTHTGEGRLARRLGIHASGDRRGSVLRLHLGGALLARDAPGDQRLTTWYGDKRAPTPDVEEAVSALLRERFTVCCIPVTDRDERLELERGLIALLAQRPLGPPSEGWLGRHAFRLEIRRSGLWNTDHVDAKPMGEGGLKRLEAIVAETRASPQD